MTDLVFRLASRHQALVQLGMINSPSDVPAFARDLQVFPSFFFLFNLLILDIMFLLVRVNLKKLSERFLRSWIDGRRCRLTRIRVRIDNILRLFWFLVVVKLVWTAVMLCYVIRYRYYIFCNDVKYRLTIHQGHMKSGLLYG